MQTKQMVGCAPRQRWIWNYRFYQVDKFEVDLYLLFPSQLGHIAMCLSVYQALI